MKGEPKMAKSVSESIAESVNGFGGYLRCEVCGTKRPLGDTRYKFLNGWPKHCGYTMRWWTQRQIDAGEIEPFTPVAATGPDDAATPPSKLWSCSVHGVVAGNTFGWCAGGCGREAARLTLVTQEPQPTTGDE